MPHLTSVGPSNNFNTTLVVSVPQIGVHNVSVGFILTPTPGIRVSLLELYHNAHLDTKAILADGSVSFTIHFELEPLKDILIRNIVEILHWRVSLYNYTSYVQTQINVLAHSGPLNGNGNENLVSDLQGDASLNVFLAVTVTVILLSTICHHCWNCYHSTQPLFGKKISQEVRGCAILGNTPQVLQVRSCSQSVILGYSFN